VLTHPSYMCLRTICPHIHVRKHIARVVGARHARAHVKGKERERERERESERKRERERERDGACERE